MAKLSDAAVSPERKTLSGIPVLPCYGLDDLPPEPVPAPGQFPYTRGIHETMYRGKLWTMRQFSGFATPEETNRGYLISAEPRPNGSFRGFRPADVDGLRCRSWGFCRRSREVRSLDIVARGHGNSVSGHSARYVTVSMTINSPAPILWAMYLAVAEKQGVDWNNVSGTLQNDILKEYIAQKEYIYPPRPSMRLVTDVIEYAAKHVPRFNPISISGYHIREAGSTAVQELAFTLRDGIEYVEWALARGLSVDEFAPRLSFFFNSHNDFFEEIAKFRAARKIWAEVMRERFRRRTSAVGSSARMPKRPECRSPGSSRTTILHGQLCRHSRLCSAGRNLCIPTLSMKPTRSRASTRSPSRCGLSK